MSIPVYSGPFGRAEAERLLWRAGFGPRAGEANALAAAGMTAAVRSLTNPPAPRLTGPEPTSRGEPRRAATGAGSESLWWLDRMVRSNQPLVERMTLVWHDWFATRGIGPAKRTLLLRQNQLLRRRALGSFRMLALDITRDPAMLLFLSGVHNRKGRPNENYARELMELFTLGAGRGYTERDVREQARALTGFTFTFRATGHTNFRYERRRHDPGVKRIFGTRGRFDYRRAVDLCLRHPDHASFFVDKLWSYFIPTPPDDSTREGLIALYRRRQLAIKPVLEAILMHPDLYTGPRMVKPPMVYAAGLIRSLGDGVTQKGWKRVGFGADTGQRLLAPPSVSGWDDTRWLDTATFLGRWNMADVIAGPHAIRRIPGPYDPQNPSGYLNESGEAAVDRALAFWGNPSISPETRRPLVEYAEAPERVPPGYPPDQPRNMIVRQNGLRLLIAACPEMQTA